MDPKCAARSLTPEVYLSQSSLTERRNAAQNFRKIPILWQMLYGISARGMGYSHISYKKGRQCSSEILTRIRKKYQGPVLWAWLEMFFTP